MTSEQKEEDKPRDTENKTGTTAQSQGELLKSLAEELERGPDVNKEKLKTLGEKLLLLWTKSMTKNSTGEHLFESVHQILFLADDAKDYLPFSFLLTLQSALNIYLIRQRDVLMESKRSFDLLVPALSLMQFALKIMEKFLNINCKNTIQFDSKPGIESRLCLSSIMTLRLIIDIARIHVNLWCPYLQTNFKIDSLVQFFTSLMNKRAGPEICHSIVELLLCLASIRETADYLNKATLISQINMVAVLAYERPYAHLSQLAATNPIVYNKSKLINNENPREHQLHHQAQQLTPLEQLQLQTTMAVPMSDTAKIYLENINSDHNWLPIYWHVIRLNISMVLTLDGEYLSTGVEFLSIHCIRICELLELLRTKPRSINIEEVLQHIYMINLVLKHGNMWLRKDKQSYLAISDEIAKTAYTLATSALPPPTTITTSDTQQQQQNQQQLQQHFSMKPRDCLIYAKCCYDFGKHTEAERVLFQTKFGDKDGFIKEAGQIYGDKLSIQAFHLAAQICLKTNRQPDAIEFALQVFADDCEYLDVVSAFTQNR